MSAIIYPIGLHRRFEQRRAARMIRGEPRHSPLQGTVACTCGHTVIAPSSSTCAANEIVNRWECSACGRRWETTAPGRDDAY